MFSELTTLMCHGTWDLVPPPMSCNLMGYKWVFGVKWKLDGFIDRFKVRLAAKGYNQRLSLDYKKTFCPIVKLATIKIVLNVAIING